MADVDDDLSASTQRFQAFAQGQQEELPAPWQMRASRSKIWILVGVVIAVAIVAAIMAGLLVG
jgi:hypothetical protein